MCPSSRIEASASIMRKSSNDTPEHQREVIAPSNITPSLPRLVLRRNLRSHTNDPPSKACNHCSLCGTGICCPLHLTGFTTFSTTQQNFEEELEVRIAAAESAPATQSQSQSRSQVHPRKSVTWNPIIRTRDCIRTEFDTIWEYDGSWWEDPKLLKASECTLSQGKYLDAFMALPCEDVENMLMLLPPELGDEIMAISRRAKNKRDSIPDKLAFGKTKLAGDKTSSKGNTVSEHIGFNGDPVKMFAHRRLLAKYFDSRLEDYVFCRYLGIIKLPAGCPKREIEQQQIKVANEESIYYGPTNHIVSNWNRSDRPTIHPIRFSQAHMAMKFHRLGKVHKGHTAFLDIGWRAEGPLANHFVTTLPWISGDRLILRTQSWIYTHELSLTSKTYVQDFLDDRENHIFHRYRHSITWACHHLKNNLNPDRHYYSFTRPEGSAQLRRCKQCAFEYRIDTPKAIPLNFTTAKYHRITTGFCAVVTTYRDFGRCLTPYDPRWSSHFTEYSEPDFITRFPPSNQKLSNAEAEEEPTNDWELGGIMQAFEGCDELVETELSMLKCQVQWLVSDEEWRKTRGQEVTRKNARRRERKAEKLRKVVEQETRDGAKEAG